MSCATNSQAGDLFPAPRQCRHPMPVFNAGIHYRHPMPALATNTPLGLDGHIKPLKTARNAGTYNAVALVSYRIK